MKKHDTVPEQADELRQRAEALARGNADWSLENLEVMPPSEAIRRTFHELRVHQIELEMQNEELRRSQVELEAARARYFDLYDLAPVGYCTLSEPGLILEANLTVATLLGVARSALINQRLARFIHKEDANQFHLLSQRLFTTQPADSTRAPQADPCLCQDFLLRAPLRRDKPGFRGRRSCTNCEW